MRSVRSSGPSTPTGLVKSKTGPSYQRYVSEVPFALTVNVAGVLNGTCWSAGCVAIDGAMQLAAIVTGAATVDTSPQSFDARSQNDVALRMGPIVVFAMFAFAT